MPNIKRLFLSSIICSLFFAFNLSSTHAATANRIVNIDKGSVTTAHNAISATATSAEINHLSVSISTPEKIEKEGICHP